VRRVARALERRLAGIGRAKFPRRATELGADLIGRCHSVDGLLGLFGLAGAASDFGESFFADSFVAAGLLSVLAAFVSDFVSLVGFESPLLAPSPLLEDSLLPSPAVLERAAAG
jgi:hypothetical protein